MSVSWLLMYWLLTSPGHQHPWYWLWIIGKSLFYTRNDFNYPCHMNVYPTLGCDIQGFGAMGLSVQYWPRWYQDFRRSDWLCHSEQMGPIWGYVPCQKKKNCVWNKLFLGEIKFSQSRTRPVKSLWWQIVPMQESTNEWKNLTIFEVMGLAETQR